MLQNQGIFFKLALIQFVDEGNRASKRFNGDIIENRLDNGVHNLKTLLASAVNLHHFKELHDISLSDTSRSEGGMYLETSGMPEIKRFLEGGSRSDFFVKLETPLTTF